MDALMRLIRYVPEKKALPILAIIFSIAGAILCTWGLYFVYIFFRSIVYAQPQKDVLAIAITTMTTIALGGLLYFIGDVVSHAFAFRLETNLKKTGIECITCASYGFFDKQDSGYIRRVIDDNSSQTHSLIAHVIPDTAFTLTTLIGLLIIGFTIHLAIGLSILFLFICTGICIYKMMGNSEFLNTYLKFLEEMNAQAVGYVRGMQVIKTFNADIKAFKALYKTIRLYSRCAYDYTMLCRIWYNSFEVLFMITPGISGAWAAIAISQGFKVEDAILYALMITLLSSALYICLMRSMMIGESIPMAQNCLNKLEGLFDEMRHFQIEHGTDTVFNNFDIEFRSVDFGYSKDKGVLKDFSLYLPEHKSYAFVGPSGSGKTTIANLISGFYKVDKGSITIGGKPIETYSQKALNDNIAFVFQNSHLFNTTLYENVLMGNPEATRQEVLDAMDKAGCREFIEKLKDREMTVVGSKGTHLSGGEIQRIAIARALLKNANIIILDEASAATDPQCEYEILQAFKTLIKDKTVIIIAHRLTSIKGVDEIVVIDAGKVVEKGSDSQLMEEQGLYKKLQDLYKEACEWKVKYE